MQNDLGPEGVARGEDALTVLEKPTSRSQFIDELMEVKIMRNISNFILYLTCFNYSLGKQAVLLPSCGHICVLHALVVAIHRNIVFILQSAAFTTATKQEHHLKNIDAFVCH